MEGVKAATDQVPKAAPRRRADPSNAEEQQLLTSKVQDDHAVDEDILGKAAEMREMMFKHDSLAPKKKAAAATKKKSLMKLTTKQTDSEVEPLRAGALDRLRQVQSNHACR